MKLEARQAAIALTLALASTVGCARQPEFAASDSTLKHRTLPFHANSGTQPRLSDRTALESGTPVPVHLQTPLSSSLGRAGDTFTAILEHEIVSRGTVFAAKGAVVIGKILEAKPSDPSHEAGYLRLTLTEISLDGKSWPLQTSNVFVKGATYQRDAATPPMQLVGATKALTPRIVPPPARIQVREEAEVSSGRLLIFRLTQPVSVENIEQ